MFNFCINFNGHKHLIELEYGVTFDTDQSTGTPFTNVTVTNLYTGEELLNFMFYEKHLCGASGFNIELIKANIIYRLKHLGRDTLTQE